MAPAAEGIVEFKVRAIHAISTRYAELMELDDDSPSGNHFTGSSDESIRPS